MESKKDLYARLIRASIGEFRKNAAEPGYSWNMDFYNAELPKVETALETIAKDKGDLSKSSDTNLRLAIRFLSKVDDFNRKIRRELDADASNITTELEGKATSSRPLDTGPLRVHKHKLLDHVGNIASSMGELAGLLHIEFKDVLAKGGVTEGVAV